MSRPLKARAEGKRVVNSGPAIVHPAAEGFWPSMAPEHWIEGEQSRGGRVRVF